MKNRRNLLRNFARIALLMGAAWFGLAQSGHCLSPSGRGGLLLPSGNLSTNGSQIIDSTGTPVRIASVGWYGTDGPAGYALQGLWQTSYKSICDGAKAGGFNCIRIPWADVNLDTPLLATNAAGGVNWTANSDLQGLGNFAIFQKIVSYCSTIGLKVIFDHHTNDGGGGQQPNGLWFDNGPGSDNTDHAGHAGTITDAQFKSNWQRFARAYAGNSTVIGYDLDNEPLAPSSIWGGGGNTDIHAMYVTTGNLIQAIDNSKLIICEGIIGDRNANPPYSVDLSIAQTQPVVLNTPNKVIYSLHPYGSDVGGQNSNPDGTFTTRDSGAYAISLYNRTWGVLVTNNIAPVWLGEYGSSMDGRYHNNGLAGEQAWAQTLTDYMNGKLGAQGGPTFTGNQQGVSGSWWNLGAEANDANPNGIQTSWGPGNYRPEQVAVTDLTLMKSYTPGSSGGNGFTNPGFEAGNLSGWSTWVGSSNNGMAAFAQNAGSGAHSGGWEYTDWSSSPYELTTYQTISVPNGMHTVSAWIKSSGGQSVCRMETSGYGGNTVYTNIGASSGWTQISATVNVTSGLLTLGFYSNAAGNQWLNVDDVEVALAAPTNYLINPGFETGNLNGWSLWAGSNGGAAVAENAGSAAHTGSYQYTNWSASPYELTLYQSVAIPNGTHTVTAWIKSSGGQANCQMFVRYYGGNPVTVNIPGPTDWQQISTTVNVTTGTLEVSFYSKASANQWFNADDIVVN